MNLIKVHFNLIKYIIQEIKKKKKIKEHIAFFKNLGKEYFKILAQEFKNLSHMFDKEFRAKKRQMKKHQKIKTDLNRALKILRFVDAKMTKSGVSRQRRRQFWRDFYSQGQCRKDIFEDIAREIK